MLDEWTNNLPDGRIVFYTRNIGPETGGVITAHIGDITHTDTVHAPMTREEVEAHFTNL